MNEAALYWGLGLLGVALLLVLIDVFVPSAGVLAITALAVAIAGVVSLFNYSTSWGFLGLLGVVVGSPVLFFFGLRIFPHTPIGRRLVLGGEREDGEDAPPPSAAGVSPLVGAEGVVVTDLRPVGSVRIGDQRYDALSETTLIRAGQRIRVTAVEGFTLKVRPLA